MSALASFLKSFWPINKSCCLHAVHENTNLPHFLQHDLQRPAHSTSGPWQTNMFHVFCISKMPFLDGADPMITCGVPLSVHPLYWISAIIILWVPYGIHWGVKTLETNQFWHQKSKKPSIWPSCFLTKSHDRIEVLLDVALLMGQFPK